MLDAQAIAVFPAVSLPPALLPEPGSLFVPAQSTMKGRAAGMFVTAGLIPQLSVANR